MTNRDVDDTQEKVQKVLEEVQMIDDELPEPWSLNNSIGELERTVSAYRRLRLED